MSADKVEALNALREAHNRLTRSDAPPRVDLRNYVAIDSPAWNAYVDARAVPGYSVKLATMVKWLDEVIVHLKSELEPVEPPGVVEPVEPPSPRDTHRAGDRLTVDDAAPASERLTEIIRYTLSEREGTDPDASPRTDWPVPPPTFPEDANDEWLYGPAYDEAAQKERAHLNAIQREERALRWVEEQAKRQAREASAAPVTPHHPPSAPHAGGEPLRQLTSAGIERARVFLAQLRERPETDRTPPRELLHGERYSRPFDETVTVEPRTFRTRREAGEYLSGRLAPIRHRVVDDAGVWSWLGMYYFAEMAPNELSPNNMTFLFESGEHTSNASRSDLQRYRNYLWGSWTLYERHGERAAFLLEQEISSWDDLSQRSFGSNRVFNSLGVVQLILRLYTEGAGKKRGHIHRAGGLRHLLRVLPQLELTYDVYGMEPDALLRVLPPVFREWDMAGADGRHP